MKKLLLGSTTLIGAAALSTAAFAALPKVTLGGVADFQVGILSQDQDADQRNHAFRSDTEVSIKVDGKHDNGLGYGAEIWLEADVDGPDSGFDADNQGFNASRTFVYLQGMWGRAEMGSNLGADQTLKIGAESIARATGGIDGDWYYFANNGAGGATPAMFLARPDLPINYGYTGAGVTGFGDEDQENLNKITYYTPRWSGFQLGLSYAPNDESRGQTVTLSDARGVVTPVTGGPSFSRSENVFQAGVNWEGTFNQFGIALAATGEIGDAEAAGYEDLQAWQVGGRVTYLGFSVAGSYGDWGDSLRADGDSDDNSFWTVGGAYEYGPYGLSVTYLNSESSNGLTTPGDNEFDNIVVGADYQLAPGLTPYAEVSFFDADGVAAGADNEGTVFLLGTQLNF